RSSTLSLHDALPILQRGYLKMIMVIFKHFPQFVNTWDVSYLGRGIQFTQISSFAHVTMVAIIKTVRMFHTHRHLHHLMCMNRKLKMLSNTWVFQYRERMHNIDHNVIFLD